MKKADNFDAKQWLVENKITFQSRLNENKIPGVNIEVDDDMITLSGDSGDYDGFVEGNGTVSFTVTNDEEEFNDQNWKDILGDDHVFVKIANAINTDVEAIDDYVMITVKADDLTGMNESKVNENETSGTTYLTIKEPLTQAMEAMGYEKPPLESDNWATAYSSLSYVKPLSDTELLEVEVRPAPEKGKVADKEFGSDFEEEGKTDYPVINFEMYIKKTEDKEEKKFFGLMKKKYQDQSYDYIVKSTYLDLSKNTTEEAVNKITRLVKQKEPK